MDSLIVIFVAVGALGILVWLIVAAMRASNRRNSGDSSTSGGDSGHSHDPKSGS